MITFETNDGGITQSLRGKTQYKGKPANLTDPWDGVAAIVRYPQIL